MEELLRCAGAFFQCAHSERGPLRQASPRYSWRGSDILRDMVIDIVDGVVRDQIVRVADLMLTRRVVDRVTFENCLLVGPAIIALIDGGDLIGCTFETSEVDQLLWPVQEGDVKIGAVHFMNCNFHSCKFESIGFVAWPSFEKLMRDGFAAMGNQ